MAKQQQGSTYSDGTHRPADSDLEDFLKRLEWEREQQLERQRLEREQRLERQRLEGTRPILPVWEVRLRRWERERLEREEGIQMEQLVPAHSDGTITPRLARDLSKEDKDAIRAAGNFFGIAKFFKFPEDRSDGRIEYFTSGNFEAWLDEVQGYAEAIDITYELHYMGRLVHLLHHVLYHPHASIRAKTAELVTTMVKNNHRSQKLVMEANGLQPLLYNFISDPDATSRTKALGAISSLIQNNKPGITAFRLANGYKALKETLYSENVMLLREVLNLILYLLHENSSNCNILIELGFHRIMIHLGYHDHDAEVREATLRGLLVLAKHDEGGNNGQLVKNDDEMKKVLRNQIEGIIAMEDHQDVRREEVQLMDSLWNVCYNEPSLLRQMGLLVLPVEDAPAPDVASKLFEPPLRGAWAAAEAADRNSVSGKKEAPLLLNARLKNDDKLKQVLRELKLVLHERKQVPQERIERIASSKNPDDISSLKVERQLVDSLWNACYNEGVLELCGMDAHEPYVASKPFEPLLRAWAAAETAERNSLSEKKEAPLLINVGVKNQTEPTFFISTEPNQPRSRFPILQTATNRSVQYGSSILFGFAKYIRFGRYGR